MDSGIDIYRPHHNLIIHSRFLTKSPTFSNGVTQNSDFRDEFKKPVKNTDHGAGTRLNYRLDDKARKVSVSSAAGDERPCVELYLRSYIKRCDGVGDVVVFEEFIQELLELGIS